MKPKFFIRWHFLVITIYLFTTTSLFAGGIVYLVLGSDTGIHGGQHNYRFHNFYDIDLYTNPTNNAYAAMDPAFRNGLKDSYGNSLKMTWWMHSGNIFRYATNNNVPVPNIISLYLMKKYHSENLVLNGDELSFHYHTYFWSDYDEDGLYYWNQSKTFLESLDDFNFTLAQTLLEEEEFPVSFRSGWHYMDNDWQHYLDERILPYSLHNDYPKKRISYDEPIDNIFDWSEAPSTWIPFNPSYSNYQIPGSGQGWNVRSASFGGTIYENYLDEIFAAASNGTDQVACLWGHLPDSEFINKIEAVNSLAHQMDTKYPGVTFKYCTAIEAMQLWRESTDNQKPNLSITKDEVGGEVYFNISSDETIFQSQPFVAVKDIYENYYVVECVSIGENLWRTTKSFPTNDLVKVGATACDTMGNSTMSFIEYLPADTFIDNLDSLYSEKLGNWSTNNINSWGINSRVAQLSETDSVVVQWKHIITQSTHYNFSFQVPDIENLVEDFEYVVFKNSIPIDTIKFNNSVEPYKWIYLTTLFCDESDEVIIEYRASGTGQASRNAVVDVLKISALVKDIALDVDKNIIDLKDFVINTTVIFPLTISNHGTETLEIFNVNSLGNSLISNFSFPIKVPIMSSVTLELEFKRNELGVFTDSLIIISNDLMNENFSIPIFGDVQDYFVTIDNEDLLNYSEYGQWQTSSVTANGHSSRYALLNGSPKASVEFKTKLQQSGMYNVIEIIPETVNSSNHTLYEVTLNNQEIGSVILNQNEGSGSWKLIGTYDFLENVDIIVKVSDTGESTEGLVLRADAIKFQRIGDISDFSDEENLQQNLSYQLSQNYPNPFNPSTTIRYTISQSGLVQLKIYDLLGQEVAILVNKEQLKGNYKIELNASKLTSGIYFYKLQSSGFSETKKLILLR